MRLRASVPLPTTLLDPMWSLVLWGLPEAKPYCGIVASIVAAGLDGALELPGSRV